VSDAGAAAGGSWRVPPEAAGERIDRALAERLGVPRSRVRRWIELDLVRLDGRPPAKSGEPLRAGAVLDWRAPPAGDDRIAPEPGELVLLHEDADLLVLDKPAGLVVHPGAGRGTGTLAHRLLDRFPELAGVGGPGRPGIVHRLDRGTSGVLLVARTAAAHERLARDFAARRVGKLYLAIVWGTPRARAGEIDAAIGRHPVDRKRMAVRARGRPARTVWRRIGSAGPFGLLEIELLTGRTHQIRVHLRSIGHPIVGDPVYGEPRHLGARGAGAAAAARLLEIERPALHAWRISLRHPRTEEALRFEARPPADLDQLWAAAGGAPLPSLLSG
jgi:23S rRNA pseudouridine1911/1915/1917 synthase